MKRKIRVIITSLFLLLFSLPTFVFAQTTEVSLTVSPPVAYLHVAPGTATTHTIILENSGNSPTTVLPRLVDFNTDGKTGRAIVTNQLTFPYISLGRDNQVKEVTIPPGKKAQLTLYIDVPKTAEEKEYPLTVLFFSKTNGSQPLSQSPTSANSQIAGAIGSNLVVLVARQNKFQKLLKVEKLKAPKIIDSFQTIKFTPLVKNNSLGAATASGSAKIINWKKQTVAEFEIYPDIILGHSSRELRALLSNGNLEQPEVGSFSYKPKFMIGPYQIVITLYNENQVVNQFVYVYYALPIVIIITIITGLAIYFYAPKDKTQNQEQ